MSGNQKTRIANLSSIGGILTESCRVYREARRGDLDVTTAKRLVEMLAMIRQGYEVAEIERRVAELEARR